MFKNTFEEGTYLLGTWCELPSPAVVNVLARAGLDFVIIDMEHGAMDYRIAQEMAMAAECEGTKALICVTRLDEQHILRALNTGVSGILVPHIETVIDREKAVFYSKFPPVGWRGFNPFIRSGGYHKVVPGYFHDQNTRIALGIVIEDNAALKILGSIIDDPEIDMVYIDTYDLSVDLGLAGDVRHTIVLSALEKAVATIRKARKVAGCTIKSKQDFYNFKDMGIQFITYKADSAIIYDGISGLKRKLANDDEGL